jgi:hypothetical protein
MKLKGGRWAFVVGGIAIIVLGAGWYLRRPKVHFATRAEVEAVIDPALLKPPVTDPGAEARFTKLKAELTKVKSERPSTDAAVALYQSQQDFEKNRPAIVAALALLREGPAQPKHDPFKTDFLLFSEMKNLVKIITSAALADAAEGHGDPALQKMAIASEVSTRYADQAFTLIDHLVSLAMLAIVDHSAANLARSEQLSAAQLERLLAILPSFDPDRRLAKQVLIGEFQNYTVPLLPRMGSDLVGRASLEDFGAFGFKEDGQMRAGQYDAIETAKLASRLAMALLKDADVPYPKHDKGIAAEFEKITQALPEDNFSDKPPSLQRAANEFAYNFRMNNLPNSLGKLMISGVGIQAMQATSKERALRQATRALVALEIFRKRTGRYPDSLATLVSKGILASQPYDEMADGPLRYSLAKGLVYSVGTDSIDGGGDISRDFYPLDKDWGFRLVNISLIKPRKTP